MEHFTGAQRAFCLKAYYKNGLSSAIARREFCSKYSLDDLNQCPSESMITTWVNNFESTGSTLDLKPAGSKSIHTEKSVSTVAKSC